jgi:hypothetical protein
LNINMLEGKNRNSFVFVIAIVVNICALPHFQVYDSTTGNNMLVIVDTNIHPNINGINLVSGDEIGVFNSTGLCVGAGRWVRTNNISIAVYGQNTYSTSTDGMAAGEKMKFRMWDSLLNIEVPASATYGPFQVFPPDSTYGQDLYSFLASLSGISAPAVPVLSSPANGAGNQSVSSLGLSWSTSARAASYEVEVSTTNTFGNTVYDQTGASLTSTTVSGLSNSTTYYWRVNASNVDSTNWSGAWSFTTIIAAPVVPVLSSPANGAGNQSVSSLGLSWSTSARAASYEVEVSTTNTFGNTVYDQTGAPLTSTMVSGLSNSTTYYWRVNASNVDSTNWSGVWSFTTIIAAPVVPTLFSPASGTSNELISPTLSWGTVANAVTYAVQVSTVSDFGSTVTAQIGLTSTSTSIIGLSNSTT